MVRQTNKLYDSIEANVGELNRLNSSLTLIEKEDGSFVINGSFSFSANCQNKGVIRDAYEVEIFAPKSGFLAVPTVKEVAERIPRTPDNHVNPDGTLCLGTRLETRRQYQKDPTLMGFVKHLLIPFLYSHSYKEKYGEYPYDDLPHGEAGTLQHYKDIFNIDSDMHALLLLKVIVEDNYRGHNPCPCGSGEKLRNCHGPTLRKIKEHQNREHFFEDFLGCFKAYSDAGGKLPSGFLTKRLENYFKKQTAQD